MATKEEKKAAKEAKAAEKAELRQLQQAQKVEIKELKAAGATKAEIAAEKKSNKQELTTAKTTLNPAGRQTLLTDGQPIYALTSTAGTYANAAYAPTVQTNINNVVDTYNKLNLQGMTSVTGTSATGLNFNRVYDAVKTFDPATGRYDATQAVGRVLNTATDVTGKNLTADQLTSLGYDIKPVKDQEGLFKITNKQDTITGLTFLKQNPDGTYTGVGSTASTQLNVPTGFFTTDFGKALAVLGTVALTLTPGGQAFAASVGSALTGGAVTGAAAQALGTAAIRGVSTGVITGDAEKGLIAGALSLGGSALNMSGELGNIFDSVGLGDYKDTFGIIGGQASEASMAAADAAGQAAQGLGADQIASNLVASGIDPTTAQTAASLATQGATASAITSSLNNTTPGGSTLSELGITEADQAADVLPVSAQGVGEAPFAVDSTQTAGEGLFNLPTGPAGFEGIDMSSQLAGGTDIGQFGQLNTGGFAGTLPTTEELTQSLITAGLAPGTAANLAGATLAGTGGVGTAGTGLLGTGAAAGALGGAAAGGLTAGQAANLARTAGGLLGGTAAGGTFGGLNIGGMLGAGIDFAQLEALRREATGLGREIAGEASRIGREGAVPFTPYTVTTGAGVGTVGPGGATAVTSPEMQALRQQQLGLAGQAFGTVNPAQAAEALYQRAEALAAPGRAREQEALLAGLQARGLTGFGQNLPTVGGGVRTVNPLFESLLSAQETARAQQALQAQQFGTQEATRQAALGQGLVGGAQQIDQQALAALNAAATLGSQERELARRNALLQAEAGLRGLELRSPYERAGLYFTGQALTGLGGATRGLFGLPTQQGNVGGSFNLNQVLDLFGGRLPPTSPLGEGTGVDYGFQDYGQYF